MLYDPKWEAPVKADPLSLAALIAWLEKKPPDAKYEYLNCDGMCFFGQYMTEIGIEWSNDNYIRVTDHLDSHIAHGGHACGSEHTFGGALRRAREIAGRK